VTEDFMRAAKREAPRDEVAQLDSLSVAQLKSALDEALVAAVQGELP
jgi:hypothetical protein